MKISTILDHIDNGHFALPEFQRGFVWNKDQIKGLFDSMYQRHPIGTLLAWVTDSNGISYRGDTRLNKGVVKLLLDGQQRMTTVYSIARGKTPDFFDGNPKVFENLMFNLDLNTFEYFQPLKMKDDPLWVDVTEVMKKGNDYIPFFIKKYNDLSEYIAKISQLIGIFDIDLHVEEITGSDKTIEIVVDIFNRVNSGGTKLSKGDLALAKICADWPEARNIMRKHLESWNSRGYNFNLDWLLRSVNTVATGEARFHYLHNSHKEEIEEGLKKAVKHINTTLNLISGRLGLDHDQVLFGKFGIPVIVRYLENNNGKLSATERDLIMFWYVQAGMWGRFSGSTESSIDKDLAALEGDGGGLHKLIKQLELWQGSLMVKPEHFDNWSLGARFYPVLYMLTRMSEAMDWGTGLPLKANLLGSMNSLEVHHIFPKSQLYKNGYQRNEVNALGNYCFLTKDTNLRISNKYPEDYFHEIEKKHPGALSSQWIPEDSSLWAINKYKDFLEARRVLLSEAVNKKLKELLHNEIDFIDSVSMVSSTEHRDTVDIKFTQLGDEEEGQLQEVNKWMSENNLPPGLLYFDYANEEGGVQKAVFDLAWPKGIQEEYSQPVALVLSSDFQTISLASSEGFRCFTGVKDFKKYVLEEIL